MSKPSNELRSRIKMNTAFTDSSMCYCYDENCKNEHAAAESKRLQREITPVPISTIWVHEILGRIQDRPKCPYCNKTMVIGQRNEQ